jgi:hypothetical protein
MLKPATLVSLSSLSGICVHGDALGRGRESPVRRSCSWAASLRWKETSEPQPVAVDTRRRGRRSPQTTCFAEAVQHLITPLLSRLARFSAKVGRHRGEHHSAARIFLP